MSDDDAIRNSEQAAEKSEAARLFDIRRIIGGLFTLYGVVLLVAGVLDGAAASDQAAGIDINIWTGLGMGVFGLAFLAWMHWRPLQPPPEGQEGQGDDAG